MERLYRSRNNRVIAGVCGGFAEYFHIDVTIIRIITIIIAMSGTGVLAYIIGMIIIPDEGNASSGRRSEWERSSDSYADGRRDRWEQGQDKNADSGRSEWNQSSAGSAGSAGSTNNFVNEMKDESNKWDQPPKYASERNRFVLGAILVGLGILFLGKQLIPALFRMDYLAPLLLIGIGGFIVYRGRH